ncbi:MAG TPA: sugar phosphate isomerase/epimerase family protein [Tepidisphaeraceae bacterium]|jgi:sugar phosphate isomerase/epimerase
MILGKHAIGVCDWSLRLESVEELISRLNTLGLTHVQLALSPHLEKPVEAQQAVFKTLADAGIAVTAGQMAFAGENYASIATIRKTGGFVPSDTWPARRDATLAGGKLAARAGIKTITLHLGFIPPSNDPLYPVIVSRTAEVAAAFAADGISLLLETGQEKAPELLRFLNDLNARNVGVNYDPANMLLYGAGDPVDAITTLGRHIQHVHIKDALHSVQPGVEWGTEIGFGLGDLPHTALFTALANVDYGGPLVIEREATSANDEDFAATIERLASLISEQPPATIAAAAKP